MFWTVLAFPWETEPVGGVGGVCVCVCKETQGIGSWLWVSRSGRLRLRRSWCFSLSLKAGRIPHWGESDPVCGPRAFTRLGKAHHTGESKLLYSAHKVNVHLTYSHPQRHTQNNVWTNIWVLWPSQLDTFKWTITSTLKCLLGKESDSASQLRCSGCTSLGTDCDH